jgi:predicted membrane chloride channel (bestrophin family)
MDELLQLNADLSQDFAIDNFELAISLNVLQLMSFRLGSCCGILYSIIPPCFVLTFRRQVAVTSAASFRLVISSLEVNSFLVNVMMYNYRADNKVNVAIDSSYLGHGQLSGSFISCTESPCFADFTSSVFNASSLFVH